LFYFENQNWDVSCCYRIDVVNTEEEEGRKQASIESATTSHV